MFIDRAEIYIKAGNGGHGAVASEGNMYLQEDQQEVMAVRAVM